MAATFSVTEAPFSLPEANVVARVYEFHGRSSEVSLLAAPLFDGRCILVNLSSGYSENYPAPFKDAAANAVAIEVRGSTKTGHHSALLPMQSGVFCDPAIRLTSSFSDSAEVSVVFMVFVLGSKVSSDAKKKSSLWLSDADTSMELIFSHRATLMEAWTPAAALFPGERFKQVGLWRSPQLTIPRACPSEQLTLNLWFATRGTNCGLHRHDAPFRELHTQLHGVGRMQAFSDDREAAESEGNNLQHPTEKRPPQLLFDPGYDQAGLEAEIIMVPGLTHKPFFYFDDADEPSSDLLLSYPLHQYRADSDCVWLAIETMPAA